MILTPAVMGNVGHMNSFSHSNSGCTSQAIPRGL
jgi:hypothetical protein